MSKQVLQIDSKIDGIQTKILDQQKLIKELIKSNKKAMNEADKQ